jgi:hypothetical protein
MNDLVVTCDPSEPEPIEDFGEQWCILEELPSSILNYDIEILCPGETPPPPPNQPTGNNTGGTDNTGGGTNTDCSGLSLNGPFEGITPRPTEFSWTWNGSDEGVSFQLVFVDYQGNFAGSFFTDETSMTVNVGQVPTGSELQWMVLLYIDDQFICGTQPTPPIYRVADPLAPPSEDFSVQVIGCYASSNDESWIVTIRWSDLDSGESLTFAIDSGFDSASFTTSALSGTHTLQVSIDSQVNIRVTTSGGDSYSNTCYF